MQNWSCMHLCGHSSVKFYGHVMLGLRIHFLYFKSTQCFQNMFFNQFVHSSESISGVRENFHSIHPSGVYTFFQKLVMISEFFFKEKLEIVSFQKHVGFSARQLIFLFSLFFLFIICLFLFLVCFCFFPFFFMRYFAT